MLTKIPKFRRCVIQSFPFIEEDFDALTDYELLCKVVEYLNKVITSQNEVVEATEDLLEAFSALQSYVATYFENLDVQEEINNKLDEMAEDGTLQEIITEYIQANVAWTFDTVADMKLATNLVAGSYAKTLGFHTINDGGGALYYITDSGTANEMDIIAIDTLYAVLVKPSIITPEIYGAYGDGVHDDSDSIQECFTKNSKIQMDKTYLISKQLSFNGSIYGLGKGLIQTDKTSRITGAFIASTTYLLIDGMNFDCGSNVEFTLDDKFSHYNLAIAATGKLIVSNCEFHNLYEKFIRITGNTTSYIDIHDNLLSSDNKTNVYMSICIDIAGVINEDGIINIHDNTLKGYEYDYVGTYDNDSNINASGMMLSNVNVKEINIDSNVISHLGRYGSVSGNLGLSRICAVDCYFNVKPFHFANNKLINCHWTALRLHGATGAVINNNLITVARACSEPLMIISDSYNSTGEAPVGCDDIMISNNTILNKNNIFEQGIFINSYSAESVAGSGNDGFHGHVNNFNLVNNTINFCSKNFLVFDYSLKKCNIINNFMNSDFSGVTSMPSHIFLAVDTRSVMKTATVGKDFSNTFINMYSNNLCLDGVIVQSRTTDSDLTGIWDDLTFEIDKNRLQNTSTGYVLYSTEGQPFNLINNIIKASVGGVFNANKAYNNIVFYQSGSSGIYNATTSQNNSEYTN